ncbi:MAG: TROVE domain-containing protein [Candidatus Kariarchaeaceae archaeon]|jgi:hypothetical protein
MKIGLEKGKDKIEKDLRSRLKAHSRVGDQGGEVLEIDNPVEALIHLVGAGFFNEPRYYDSDDVDEKGLSKNALEVLQAILNAIEFINKNSYNLDSGWKPDDFLIVTRWVREGLKIRTTPTIMYAMAAAYMNDQQKKDYLPAYAPFILSRADDILQTFAFYRHYFQKEGELHKGSVPRSLRRGMINAFHKQSVAQLLKYNTNKVKPNIKDVLIMLRDVQYAERHAVSPSVYEYIVNGTVPDDTDSKIATYLRTHEAFYKQKEFTTITLDQAKMLGLTWENMISHFGSKKEIWEALIVKKMIPFMATLRNLRNFEQAGISDGSWKFVYNFITEFDPEKHKQLPFRFISAYDNVTSNVAKEAVSIALDKSVVNLVPLEGKTFVMTDNSGSMDSTISGKSQINMKTVANTLTAIIAKMGNYSNVIGTFGTDWAKVNYTKNQSIMDIKKEVDRVGNTTGYGTDMTKALNYLLNSNQKFDRIIVLSDMNAYDSGYGYGGGWGRRSEYETPAVLVQRYQKQINPNVWVYSINLAGAVDAQVDPQNPRVHLLSGWSEKLLDLIVQLEGKEKTTVQTAQLSEAEKAVLPTIEVLREKYAWQKS